MMLDIFSSKILFSRSISVYFPIYIQKDQDGMKLVTFLDSLFFSLSGNLVVLEWRRVELFAHSRSHSAEALLVDLLVLLVPAALEQLA